MRIPLAANLESRDGTVTKDAKVVNGIIEPKGQDLTELRSRPGNSDLGLVRAGTAQGAYYFNGNIITVHSGQADRTTLPLANNNIGGLDRTFTAVSLTRAGGTALFSAPISNGFVIGDSVVIAGANETAYNGTFTITSLGTASIIGDQFRYAVVGAPATPATGTITATAVSPDSSFDFADNGLTSGTTGYLYMHGAQVGRRLRSDWNLSDYFIRAPGVTGGYFAPGVTVPGAVFLDGYYFVMDATGTIWNCDLNADPSSLAWQTTSFLKANKFAGAGVRLTRSLNYVVALKEHSTEVFYDAGNPAPGSPLSPVDNAYSQVGCASAASVANVDGSVIWISQSQSKGRGVTLMRGAQQQRVSTPDIDRILDADTLATVYAYGFTFGGHVLYVLTLVTSNITLVYDLTTQQWVQWSSLTAQTPASITSITRSGTTVTVTFAAAHSLVDGDPLLIAGATPSAYNGLKQVSYVSTTVVTFEDSTSPTTPATGTITGTRYVESYFKFSHYVNAGGRDVLLHESDGHLYEILSTVHQDSGSPINVFTRTAELDAQDLSSKKMPRMAFVADALSDHLMVRWSDDDGATHNAYKRVDLSLDRPRIRRCGKFRRRSIETRFVGNNALRVEAIELEAAK